MIQVFAATDPMVAAAQSVSASENNDGRIVLLADISASWFVPRNYTKDTQTSEGGIGVVGAGKIDCFATDKLLKVPARNVPSRLLITFQVPVTIPPGAGLHVRIPVVGSVETHRCFFSQCCDSSSSFPENKGRLFSRN